MFWKIFGFKEVEEALEQSFGYDISPQTKKRVQIAANSDGTPKLVLEPHWPPLVDMQVYPPDAYVFGPAVRTTPESSNDGAGDVSNKKRAKR